MNQVQISVPIAEVFVDPRLERITTRYQVIHKLTGKHKEAQKEKLAEQEAEWLAFQRISKRTASWKPSRPGRTRRVSSGSVTAATA